MKATFGLVPDSVMTVAPPDEIRAAEVHYDGDPARSARLVSDLSPYRKRADVLLTGHAYSPTGAPVFATVVRLVVVRGRPLLEKAFQVVGDRTTGAPVKFARLPLVYERAFGGIGWDDNPVGTGALSGSPPPNLVHPSDARRTVCFGPITRGWPSRARLLGPFERSPLEGPIAEIPSDLDFDYFQDAPADQQIPYLFGDEWIMLEGLHPTWPVLETQLPGARAVGKVYGLGAARERGHPIALKADHLHIDTDRGLCSVAWRASVPVVDESVLSRMLLIVGVEIAGQSLEWPDPAALFEELVDKKAARPPASAEAPPAAPASAPQRPSAVPTSPFEGTMEFTADERERVLGAIKALPFAKTPAPSSAPPPAPAPARRVLMDSPLAGTLAMSTEEAEKAVATNPLPFSPVPVPAPQILQAPPPEGAPPPPISLPEAPPPTRADVKSPEPRGQASKLFHDIRRSDAGRELPERSSDAVPVFYETPAGRRGPLVTFTVPWQLKPPKYSLTVGIKATFDIVPKGAAKQRVEADLPSGDVFVDDDPKKSLLYASDFAVFKARADVLLTGHAYAPGGGASMSEVRFKLGAEKGGFDRRIAVFGERVWRWTGGLLPKPTEPVQFKKIAIHYENAFGGEAFPANPVGVGFIPKGGLPAGVRVPHLEDPAALLTDPTATPAPMGFGPIPLTWQERWSKAGTYNERWVKERWPYLPEDADWSIMQAAPLSQQLEALNGDETFEIAGMHPSLPLIRGTLPKIRARCFAQKSRAAGGEFEELLLRLDTASFDVDAMKVSLIWRGLIEVSDDDAPELAGLFVFTEELSAPKAPRVAARERFFEALERARAAAEAPSAAGAQALLDEEARRVEESEARARAAGERGREERAAAEATTLRERLRAEGASDEEIAAATAKTAKAQKAAPAPPPDEDAIADRLRRAGVGEIEVSATLELLRGEASNAPPPRPAGRAPLAKPNTAVMAEGLRAAGVGEGEIASLMKAAEDVAKQTAEGEASIETARARVIRMLEAGDPLDGLELAGADLSELDLSGISIVGANLKEANLRGARLAGANLSTSQLGGADLTGAALDGANLELADLFRATLSAASLRGALVTRADFTEARCHKASFHGAKGKGARFTGGVFSDARFDDVVIESADFSRAILDGAAFTRAVLPDVRLHSAQGVKVSFEEARIPGARADGAAFPHGSFRSAGAPGSIWNKALLDDATFFGAVLRRASFFRASCRRVNLSAADLADARLDRAKLAGARLVKCNLMAASLQQAELLNADLRGANMYACNAFRASLSGAQLDLANLTKSTLKARS